MLCGKELGVIAVIAPGPHDETNICAGTTTPSTCAPQRIKRRCSLISRQSFDGVTYTIKNNQPKAIENG